MHNCGAIFYNHESPRRAKEYVTQKIVHNVCQIYKEKKKNILLGDLSAKIDWGYAKDYVEASWKIMQLKIWNKLYCRIFCKKMFCLCGPRL